MVSCLPLPKLRYKQGGKSFRRRQQHEARSVEQLAHISTSDSRHSPPCSVELPVELWLEVIRHMTDAEALAQLVLVNRTFHAAAEPALYHNVRLETDNAIVKFSQSLVSGPHRSGLVHALTVSTLVMIPHSFATRLEPLPHWGVKGCKAVLSVHYPALRVFTSNLSKLLVTPFLRKHADLEEVHLVGHPTLFSRTPPQAVANHRINFQSLRSLTCPHRFLHGALYLPPTLTHLQLLPLNSNILFLPSASASFKPRLVSLRVRLSSSSLHDRQALSAITLDDVVESFPSLKYLQVDMHYTTYDPYELRSMVSPGISWTAKCDPQRRTTPAHRLTVAWVFSYPRDQGVDMVRAARWHKAVKEIALQVLLEWEHVVERIIFRHTIIPYVSVTLNESRTGLVSRQEREMDDDYWNTV